jgi:hypothetical protein
MTSVDGLRPHSLKQQSCTFFFFGILFTPQKSSCSLISPSKSAPAWWTFGAAPARAAIGAAAGSRPIMIPNSRDPWGRRRRRPPPLSAVARAGAAALASPKLLLSVIAAAEAGVPD